jgi:hypothetical protein
MVILLEYIRGKIQRCEKEEKEKRGWLLFEVVVILAISVFVPYKLLGFWIGYMLGLGLGIIFLAIAAFLSIYFILAPNNCFFTFVYEGTGRFISKGGKVVKVIIQWEGHTLDENGYVVPENTWIQDGEAVKVTLDSTAKKLKIEKKDGKMQEFKDIETIMEDKKRRLLARKTDGSTELIAEVRKYKEPWHPFGGLRYIGPWPIYDIYFYDFAWTGIDQAGNIDPHPKESLGFFILTDDNYLNSAMALETKPPENLPVDLLQPVTIRIANPRKAIFAAERWLEIVLQNITSIDKDFVRMHTWEELIAEKDIGGQILEMARERMIIEELFYRYGIDVRKILTKDLRVTTQPTTDLQRATLERFKAEQEAKAIAIRADAEKKKRTTETMGTIIQMMAEATGEKPEEIQKKIKDSPRLRSQLQKFTRDLITRQVSIQGKSLIDIRVEGAKGIEKAILDIISVYKRLSSPGGSGKENTGEEEQTSPKTKKRKF